jgi:hypothetical protein
MHLTKISYLGLVLMLAGCASHASSIEASYVSPSEYSGWSCENLLDEQNRLASEVRRVAGLQDENADADAVMVGVGAILLWPVLIGLTATEDREPELASLKGKYEAVQHKIREKNCG